MNKHRPAKYGNPHVLSDPTPEVPSAKKRWVMRLIRVVGLLLLAFVIYKVDWRDSVVLADGTRTSGEIVGDPPRAWDDAARLHFRDAEGDEREYAASDLLVDDSTQLPDVNEGLLRIVRRSDKVLLAVGLLMFGCITQIGVLRWWLLLRAQEIRIPYSLAHRLTFIGFFFNNVVPGPTGGDVVKALYVAKRTDKRASAVVTVLVDRIVGIIALALIAAVVLVFNFDRPQYRELALFIGIFLGSVALASVLFFSRRIRAFLRLDGLSAKLPGAGVIRQADEAIFRWRQHKAAVLVALLLSFANQLCIQGMMLVFAKGLHVTTASGIALPWTAYMVVLPVAFIVSALPLLPGGWGVREAVFVVCFRYVDVEPQSAIALSVVNGVTSLAWSLLGGVYFLLERGSKPKPTPDSVPD